MDFTVRKKRSKSRSFLVHKKVHLCAVGLEDQKVRLRAVWMGGKIASFWSSILGSKIRVEKEAIFETNFGPQKAP